MPSREFLKEEVLACARKLAALSDIDFAYEGYAKELEQPQWKSTCILVVNAEESAVAHIVKQQLV